MTRAKAFTEEHEQAMEKAGDLVHERSRKVMEFFGERAYDEEWVGDWQQKLSYWREIREDPELLRAEFETALRESGVSNGLLPAKWMEDVFRLEEGIATGKAVE